MTVAERDRYPTRVHTGPGLLERTDPAVWPGVEHGPAVSLSISLTGNYPFNGALMLLPGVQQCAQHPGRTVRRTTFSPALCRQPGFHTPDGDRTDNRHGVVNSD